jgi:hypothetical protein
VTEKPLLLVDIDGVISLFGFDPLAPPPGSFVLVDGIGHLLSGAAGGHLRALRTRFEAVWCSGWEDKANDYLPLALGLPEPLPYLSFGHVESAPPSRPGLPLARNPRRGHWKLAAIDAYAGDQRPLAWIDDAHDDTCRAWAAGRPGPTLLLAASPATGMTADHVQELLAWADSLLEAAVPPGA